MANIKSAKKRILVNEKNTMQNKSIRSGLRTALKKAEFALEHKEDNRGELVRQAITQLDSASHKGILHQNNAARKKSQLQRKLNASA